VTLILVGSVAVGVPLWIATDGPSVTILTFVLLLPALALAHLTIGRIRDLPSFLRDQDTLLLRPDGSSEIANWSQDRSESTMLPDD
jgi:hypothetical protein